jgi:hypothetical protein
LRAIIDPLSRQFGPRSSDDDRPIGVLLQNTKGVLSGVLRQNTEGCWHKNTLQNTLGVLQGIFALSTLGN